MKRLIALLLVLTLCVSLAACGGNTPNNSAADGAWELDLTVDEFGDVTENSEVIYKTTVPGDFSNTATTSSNLTVGIFVQENNEPKYDGYSISFTLLEYNNTPATFSQSDNLELKIKIGDVVESYELAATPPNGDITLNKGAHRILRALTNGESVRCIITIDNSKYNFTLESENLHSLLTANTNLQDDITNALYSYFSFGSDVTAPLLYRLSLVGDRISYSEWIDIISGYSLANEFKSDVYTLYKHHDDGTYERIGEYRDDYFFHSTIHRDIIEKNDGFMAQLGLNYFVIPIVSEPSPFTDDSVDIDIIKLSEGYYVVMMYPHNDNTGLGNFCRLFIQCDENGEPLYDSF